MKQLLSGLVVLLLAAGQAPAGLIVGPGNVPANAYAGGPGNADAVNVDLTNTVTLGPGTYAATLFNYEFKNGGRADFTVIGSITPLLLIADNPNFTDIRPVALGTTVDYQGATGWVSPAFGGADTFTLTTTRTVYAGFYWHSPGLAGVDQRVPIAYENGVGLTLGKFAGAAPPVLGTPISSPAVGIAQERFDFSIQVDAVAAVPQPPAMVMALIGVGSVLGWGRLRRRRLVAGVCGSRMKQLLAGLFLLLLAANPAPAGLIVNGDFEGGDTGFSTEYVVPGTGIVGGQGQYGIVADPSTAHPSGAHYGDHTTGHGLMMMLNGFTTPDHLAWGQTVAVAQDSVYHFSAFISSWTPSAPGVLDVRLNGASVGTMLAPSQTGAWVGFTADWDSGAATSLDIQLRSLSTGDVGNDFALDDISLDGPAPGQNAVPEPAAALLLLSGAPALVSALGRRGRRKPG